MNWRNGLQRWIGWVPDLDALLEFAATYGETIVTAAHPDKEGDLPTLFIYDDLIE